jgi:hypothetical protein
MQNMPRVTAEAQTLALLQSQHRVVMLCAKHSLKKMKILLFIAIFALSFNALSQSSITLLANKDENISILNDRTNSRLGNGVLAWLITSNKDFDTAKLNYYSCDGRFLSSNSVEIFFSFENDSSRRKIELSNNIKNTAFGARTSALDILDYDSSEFAKKNDLRKVIKGVCANASPEKKDKLIPFFKSTQDKSGDSTVWHIFSGSLIRQGNFVTGWVEGHKTFMEDLKKSDGEVLKRKDGTPIKVDTLKKDGKSVLRFSVNCSQNLFGITNIVEYDQFGTNTSSVDDKNYKYTAPIPRTFGEAVVNFYCTVY